MSLPKYWFLLLSLVVALLTCYFFAASVWVMLMDPNSADSVKGDHITAPVMASIVVSFIFAGFHCIAHLVFWWRCITKRKGQSISLSEFIWQKEKWIFNAVRCLGYVVIVYFMISWAATSNGRFELNNMLFYVSVVLTTYTYTIWLMVLFKSDRTIATRHIQG